jgi:hypothetical protein
MSTRLWDDGRYAGGTDAGQIDNEARILREDISERWIQGGKRVENLAGGLPLASGTHDHDGKTCVGWERESPANSDAGEATLCWDFAGSTALVKLKGSTHATTADRLAMEVPGDVKPTGSSKNFRGVAYGTAHRPAVSDALPVADAYIHKVIYKVPAGTDYPDRTLNKIMVIARTRPVSTDLVVTVREIDAPTVDVDRFVGGSSTERGTVTLSAGTNYAAETTGLGITLAPGDELVIKYGATTGSASDVTIILQID